MNVRSIGGTIPISQEIIINQESLGLSDGTPGQLKSSLLQQSRSQVKSGQVRLLLVSNADITAIDRREGIHPDRLSVSPQLLYQVKEYLDERRLLGVEILYSQPDYVGVAVQTEVALEWEYNTPMARQSILSHL